MKKCRTLTVTDKQGNVREFIFKPVDQNDCGENELICEKLCPYGINRCVTMPDPRDPENPRRHFQDYCYSLGDDSELMGYVPQDTAIEKGFENDVDIFRNLINSGHLVDLRDVIHCVCEDTCDLYKKDLSGCTSRNKSCLLYMLLNKVDKRNNKTQDDSGKDESNT